MWMDLQSCLVGFLTLFHITRFGAMIQWGQWKGRSLSMLDCPNTWNSRNKALNKTQLMWWKWVRIWITMKIFYCIYQNLCLLKGALFWRAFGLPTIRSWIMQKLNCRPQRWLLIWKIRSFALIVGPRIWSRFPHTPYLNISTMEILLTWGFMVLSLSLFSWEEHKVMLSRMIKMKSSKWWGCNGGSSEERVKFESTMFIQKLLEWQVEM
jgi:hypothetical protein